jgi:hypothetical protein
MDGFRIANPIAGTHIPRIGTGSCFQAIAAAANHQDDQDASSSCLCTFETIQLSLASSVLFSWAGLNPEDAPDDNAKISCTRPYEEVEIEMPFVGEQEDAIQAIGVWLDATIEV